MNAIITSIVCGGAAVCWLLPIVQNPSPNAGHKPSSAPEHGMRSDYKEYRGQLGSVWVEASGRVAFELRGDGKDGKEFTLWFDTPADKDQNTLLENLVLDMVLHGADHAKPLTVVAKNSSGDDGSEPAKGFDVVRVGF